MKNPVHVRDSTCAPASGRINAVFKGLAAACAITCIVFVVYALLLTYTDISEQYISLVALICAAVSSASAGFIAARKMESGGLIWGVICGIIYAALLFAVNTLAGAESSGIISKITMLVCSACSCGIGGILGINRK